MFNFLRKFKQVQAEPDNNERLRSVSPATPPRHRDKTASGSPKVSFKMPAEATNNTKIPLGETELARTPSELEVAGKMSLTTSLKLPEGAAVVRKECNNDHSREKDWGEEEDSNGSLESYEPEDAEERSEKEETSHQLTQKVLALEKQQQELENKHSLVNQETMLQERLAELTAQLIARDMEANRLRYEMEDLQRDILIKSSGMDRLQAELEAAYKESECVRRRLRQLEGDLLSSKQQNQELKEELQTKKEESAESSSSSENSDDEQETELQSNVQELEQKVQSLQTQLEQVQSECDDLKKQQAQVNDERNEEMKIVQMALEEALEEKALIKFQFEQDFEKLRTVNTDREQQLLDDFEWKLREVEQTCKRRLVEKEKTLEQQKKELETKLKLAQQQLAELPQLKGFEAEVKQLKSLTLEQQRSLRVTSRQAEQLQASEKILQEEVARLKGQLDKERSLVILIESSNEKKIVDMEKRFQSRLEQQKNDVTAQWEERLKRERSRLRVELEVMHSEEKHLAVESLKVQKDQELCTAKQAWECKVDEYLKEISALKKSLTEKDMYYQEEMDKVQTNADRGMFDLRRKLDKIDLMYQERMEKLTENYEKKIEQLNWESDKKISQLEQNWQLQMSSTRATLELVKEQMERDAQERLDAAEEKHHKALDGQWEYLTNEKEKAVAELKEKLSKTETTRETELLEFISKLKEQLKERNGRISDLQGNVDLLQGGVQVLNEEMKTQTQDMQRIQTHAANKIRELETEQRRKLGELKERFAAESKRWQEQTKAMRDQFQNKMNYLIKLLRDTDQKYRNRESRKEDLEQIAKLKQALEERDQNIAKLIQEKKLYKLQLTNHHHAPRKKTLPQRSSSCTCICYESGKIE